MLTNQDIHAIRKFIQEFVYEYESEYISDQQIINIIKWAKKIVDHFEKNHHTLYLKQNIINELSSRFQIDKEYISLIMKYQVYLSSMLESGKDNGYIKLTFNNPAEKELFDLFYQDNNNHLLRYCLTKTSNIFSIKNRKKNNQYYKLRNINIDQYYNHIFEILR